MAERQPPIDARFVDLTPQPTAAVLAQGPEEGAGPWESYFDDPTAVPDVSELQTEVFWPVVQPSAGPGKG